MLPTLVTLIVAVVTSSTWLAARQRRCEDRVIAVLVAASALLLLAVAMAIQRAQQRVIDEAFWGPGSHEQALLETQAWRVFAKWMALESLVIATIASAAGAIRRSQLAFFLLIVLLLVDAIAIAFLAAGGLPTTV